MRWHSRARSNSGSYAFTFDACEGSGNGSVVTQWFSRKTGEPSDPRFGSQLASSLSGLVSCATFLNAYGVSSVMPSYAWWYHGAPPASFSARKTTRLPDVDHLAKRLPAAGHWAGVGELGHARVLHGSYEVLGRHVVLVDHHDNGTGVRHQERAHVLEHRLEWCGSELAERMAQVHPALALTLEPQPVADAQRGRHGVVAHPVDLGLLAELLGAPEIRADLAVRKAVGVVGVDQEAAHAVVELVADRALLLGGVPAGQRHGHRVVGGRRARPRRACGRTARCGRCRAPWREPRSWCRLFRRTRPTRATTMTAASAPGATAPYAEAPSAPHLGLCLRLLVRAVHEPQHRAHALVDQVDPERVQQQSDDGVAVDEHDHPGCHERRRAQHTQCGALRLALPASGRPREAVGRTGAAR